MTPADVRAHVAANHAARVGCRSIADLAFHAKISPITLYMGMHRGRLSIDIQAKLRAVGVSESDPA